VFQNTPKITAFSQITYSKPMSLLGSDGDASIYTSVAYRSLTHQFSYPQSQLDQPQMALLNAGVNWTAADGRLKLSVHGTNLLDKKYVVAGYDFVTILPEFANAALGTTGVLTAFYGNPRQVFGTIEVAF
jgi:iron complex outermembrane receptor protein